MGPRLCVFLGGGERWGTSPEQMGVGTFVYKIAPQPRRRKGEVCAHLAGFQPGAGRTMGSGQG